VDEQRLARRAKGLRTAFPDAHFPSELRANVIAFDSGFAAPEGEAIVVTAPHEAVIHVGTFSKLFARGAGAGAHPSARTPLNHVRLSYSFATPEQIHEGVRRLAQVYSSIAV